MGAVCSENLLQGIHWHWSVAVGAFAAFTSSPQRCAVVHSWHSLRTILCPPLLPFCFVMFVKQTVVYTVVVVYLSRVVLRSLWPPLLFPNFTRAPACSRAPPGLSCLILPYLCVRTFFAPPVHVIDAPPPRLPRRPPVPPAVIMCKYHYVFYPNCLHSELTLHHYCAKAIELGIDELHRRDADRALGRTTADHLISAWPGSSARHPHASASVGDVSHSQQPQTMSVLRPSQAGSASGSTGLPAEVSDEASEHAALIPRSVRHDHAAFERHNNSSQATTLLDASPYSKLHIDIPLGTQSSVLMELTHQDEHTGERPRASTSSSAYTESDTETIRGSATEPVRTAERVESESPRKSLPAQQKGPQLRTAQRARARESRMQPSQDNSPTSPRALRGTRSSVDLGKFHGVEPAVYLTKEAAAAVESDTVARSIARTPSKLRHAASKPALRSPISSPTRECPTRQSAIKITVSPSRAPREVAHHLDGSDSTRQAGSHVRASSTVSSTGSTPFATAQQSPSTTKSSNGVVVQTLPLSRRKSVTHAKQTAAGVKSLSARPSIPKFALKTSRSDSASTNRKSHSVSTSGTGTSASPPHSSRIPRMPGPFKTEHERNTVTSPTSASLRRSPEKGKRIVGQVDRRSQAEADHDEAENVRASVMKQDLEDTMSVVESGHGASLEDVAVLSSLDTHEELNKAAHSEDASRSTSSATIKAIAPIDDHILMRMQEDFSGMSYCLQLGHPPIADTMAHTVYPDVRQSESVSKNSSTFTLIGPETAGMRSNTPLSRGRSQQYIPQPRRQVQSAHSLQSSFTSELRPTAPTFVPSHEAPALPLDVVSDAPEEWYQPPPGTLMFDPFALDQFGNRLFPSLVPIGPGTVFNYTGRPSMGGINYGNGWPYPRSPKKNRNKKANTPNSRPRGRKRNDAEASSPTKVNLSGASAHMNTEEQTEEHLEEQSTPRPRPAIRAKPEELSGVEHRMETSDPFLAQSNPFASQLDTITRQAAARNGGRNNRIDWSSIRNVPFVSDQVHNPNIPQGPRNARPYGGHTQTNTHPRPDHNTLPRRSQPRGRNGGPEYSFWNSPDPLAFGRPHQPGAGIPMDETMPFPDPVAPPARPSHDGRPEPGTTVHFSDGVPDGQSAFRKTCGVVEVVRGTEWFGGPPCNTCESDLHGEPGGND
ncbi:hypothetical protein BDV95DRAFT_287029 [Massariosphaeria phaeospora]|uniref:Uncharacterized protein n=1 Tax=Massariosphaeria phaeospora TaxID=100035 RepID=A0A7C8IFK4_9PLEO|nr:hypothetical protein BDV95DRAFT_287029 [Massariosphaeria phaeospora]